jgi:hypothetical protein
MEVLIGQRSGMELQFFQSIVDDKEWVCVVAKNGELGERPLIDGDFAFNFPYWLVFVICVLGILGTLLLFLLFLLLVLGILVLSVDVTSAKGTNT